MSSGSERVILALDVDSEDKALSLVERCYPHISVFKIGKQLFTSAGPSVVKRIQQKGAKVFLDLKFHDIPNTVKHAAKAAADMGVFMFNVHAMGGERMMAAAREGVEASFGSSSGTKPILIAVTVLTSMAAEDLVSIGVERPLKEQVLKLCSMTKNSGLDGVVCSAHEIADIKRAQGEAFKVVVPGIRLDSDRADQKRVATPKEAVDAGADFLVMGREIREADDPVRQISRIMEAFK